MIFLFGVCMFSPGSQVRSYSEKNMHVRSPGDAKLSTVVKVCFYVSMWPCDDHQLGTKENQQITWKNMQFSSLTLLAAL